MARGTNNPESANPASMTFHSVFKATYVFCKLFLFLTEWQLSITGVGDVLPRLKEKAFL